MRHWNLSKMNLFDHLLLLFSSKCRFSWIANVVRNWIDRWKRQRSVTWGYSETKHNQSSKAWLVASEIILNWKPRNPPRCQLGWAKQHGFILTLIIMLWWILAIFIRLSLGTFCVGFRGRNFWYFWCTRESNIKFCYFKIWQRN